MAKSKMAVRKPAKKSRKQIDFDFDIKVGAHTKKIASLLSIAAVASLLYFLSTVASKQWESVWPVSTVILQNETQFIKQSDLVEFVNKEQVKGMLAIDLNILQNKTKKLPWVKQVKVRKVWPQTLIFEVEEHQAVARFNVGNAHYLLTHQGTTIALSDDSEELKQKSIKNLVAINIEGESIIDKQLNLVNVKKSVAIWKEFKQLKRELEIINLTMTNLTLDAVENWQLGFEQSLQINIGRKHRLARAERLVQTFNKIDDRQLVATIDLRYHNGLAVKWHEKNESTVPSNKQSDKQNKSS